MPQEPRDPRAFRHAVDAVAEAMRREGFTALELDDAIELVLEGKVALHYNGFASVREGDHAYNIRPHKGCTCDASRLQAQFCKHRLSVQLLLRVYQMLNGRREGPAPGHRPPQSSAWAVNEAPASCCLKFQIAGKIECLYTMRDIDDDLLFARVRQILPKLLDKTDTPSAEPPAQAESEEEIGDDDHRCPIHNALMKRRTKGDRSWYSHQLPDKSWCTGS